MTVKTGDARQTNFPGFILYLLTHLPQYAKCAYVISAYDHVKVSINLLK